MGYSESVLVRYKSCTFKASTYGSIIKAFGQARDLPNVLAMWTDMQDRGVAPTPMCLGCMVDALVKASRTQEAWHLVNEHPLIANTARDFSEGNWENGQI